MTTDWANITCPNNPVATLPTPTYGDTAAVFTVCTETLIYAPAELVYNAIIDFSTYQLWNTFVIGVEPASDAEEVYVNMPMNFTTTGLIPLVNTTSAEVISVLDDNDPAGYSLSAWRSDTMELGVLIQAEHANILVSEAENSTRYVSYETYYDELYVELVQLMRPQLQEEFEQQGEDLRGYVESLFQSM